MLIVMIIINIIIIRSSSSSKKKNNEVLNSVYGPRISQIHDLLENTDYFSFLATIQNIPFESEL